MPHSAWSVRSQGNQLQLSPNARSFLASEGAAVQAGQGRDHAASVQDRDSARPLLWNLHRACTKILLVWADAGYATSKLAAWAAALTMTVQVVARRDRHVFEVLPRRWVVERTFAWISKHRRIVRDYEQLPASHEAMILWAMISLMTRRLAQPTELSDAH